MSLKEAPGGEEKAGTTSDENGVLKPDLLVEIHGLVSATVLNGQRGKLVLFVREKDGELYQRWLVRLLRSAVISGEATTGVEVRPVNLTIVDAEDENAGPSETAELAPPSPPGVEPIPPPPPGVELIENDESQPITEEAAAAVEVVAPIPY